ncbi:MAG: tetratricopeptide repeat protein, partial [Rudaea sp.]
GQLIVHRDIKPSNILIAADGQAKLLDFGIAKLLDETGEGVTTIDAPHRPLTVAYAAPEQLRGDPVTTATDIYALGGVLYELLTGRRPLGETEASSLEQVLRAQTTTDPAAPSKAATADAPVSARRLRGDLDTIVLKALQREPQRRYATVAAFADDLQRFLSGQPIQARRDHTWYRVGKFVGRHRAGVALATTGALVLVAALLFALWQAREKTHQALVSLQVTQFLTGMFHGADPTLTHNATVTAQDLLDNGAQRLRADPNMEPAVKSRLLHTVAATYTDLGLYDRALPLEQQALQLRRARLAPHDPEIADSLNQLGRIYTEKADYAKAEPLLRDALTLRTQNLPADDPAIIDSLGNLGQLLQDRGDFAGADGPFREALAASERRFGADSAETAHQLDNLATNEDNLGKSAEALTMLRRALAIREKDLGPNDAEVATSLINLGTHLEGAGNHDEARKLLERALAIRLKIYGPGHPLVAYAQLSVAGVDDSVDRPAEAERLANDALVTFRRSLPSDHRMISESLNMLAVFRMERGDFAAAVPLFRDVLARYRHTLGVDHPDTLTAQNNLAATLLHAGEYAEAEQLQRDVLDRVRTDNGQSLVATDCENLATTLELEGKSAEAIEFSRRALAIQRKREGEVSGNVAVALRGLAIAEEFAGNAADAERDLRATLSMGEKLKASQGIDLFQWQLPLADFLVGTGRCGEAVPLLQSVVAALVRGANSVSQLQAKVLLGHCLAGGKRHVEGVAMETAARKSLRAMPGVEVDLYQTAGRQLEAQGPR